MKPNNVVKIITRANQETIEALEEILKLAERGEVTGLIFGLHLNCQHHSIGYAGVYRQHPLAALGMAGRLFSALDDAVQASGDEL